MKKIYTDKFGNKLNVGDRVHNKFGYDLIVYEDEYSDYYGKLVCETGDSCEDIPYSLEPAEDFEKIK